MSVWTRQELLENIALWKRAYRAVINGKSYSIGSRSLTYQDLDKIEAQLDKLQAQLDALEVRLSSSAVSRSDFTPGAERT